MNISLKDLYTLFDMKFKMLTHWQSRQLIWPGLVNLLNEIEQLLAQNTGVGTLLTRFNQFLIANLFDHFDIFHIEKLSWDIELNLTT